MKRRVLLVNPNRYKEPPVIPIGLEYLAHSAASAGHEQRLLDLCFAEDTASLLQEEVLSFNPEIIGFTVRNVDTVLFPETEFFLAGIKDLINTVRAATDAPVIIGGASIGADPEGIVSFLGADAAVVGPGENTIIDLLAAPGSLKKGRRIIKGQPPGENRFKRGGAELWREYLDNDGIGGFTTHYGCSSVCPYCIEARTPVHPRRPDDIVDEISSLSESGFDRLHLCDPELNEDLDHTMSFLRLLDRESPPIKWTLYMRPGNFNTQLFELLSKTGANLITLSADTLDTTTEYRTDLSEMIGLARMHGIRISIDLLAGFPGEDEGILRSMLDMLHDAGPDEVVVNTTLRLYERLPITRRVLNDPGHRKHVIYTREGSLVEPAFFQLTGPERLKEIIAGEGLFRIAGAQKGVNYQF